MTMNTVATMPSMSATVELLPVTSSAAIAAASSPVTCRSVTPNVPARAATSSVGHWSLKRLRMSGRRFHREHERRDLLGRRARGIPHDAPVGEEEDPVGMARGDRVVRHHRDALPVTCARRGEKAEDLATGARIEVAGGLI